MEGWVRKILIATVTTFMLVAIVAVSFGFACLIVWVISWMLGVEFSFAAAAVIWLAILLMKA